MKNQYGQVQMYAGAYNPSFNTEGVDLTETVVGQLISDTTLIFTSAMAGASAL